MALFLVVGAAELRLNNSFIDGNCISLPFQRETLMRDAVLNLDLNRSSLVDISIPGLTEPNSLRLVLHPGVFLCLADEFTYHLVIGVVGCLVRLWLFLRWLWCLVCVFGYFRVHNRKKKNVKCYSFFLSCSFFEWRSATAE